MGEASCRMVSGIFFRSVFLTFAAVFLTQRVWFSIFLPMRLARCLYHLHLPHDVVTVSTLCVPSARCCASGAGYAAVALQQTRMRGMCACGCCSPFLSSAEASYYLFVSSPSRFFTLAISVCVAMNFSVLSPAVQTTCCMFLHLA